MNCLEYRAARLTDPAGSTPTLARHEQDCDRCRTFVANLRNMDDDIRAALEVPVPADLAARITLRGGLHRARARRTSARWSAGLAATLALAVAVTWWTRDATRIESMLVDHIEHEAHQVHGTTGSVAPYQLIRVLQRIDGDVTPALERAGLRIVYASNCVIRDMLIAHLVLEDAQGQFTVMFVPGDSRSEQFFETDRWHGVITRAGRMNLAVIGDNQPRNNRARLRGIASAIGSGVTFIDA